mmetsp:Transcript_9483/g.14024  ORF Transcript_9483/g.14024 Transcript_9483/m.14024 type:complete len:200 (+) Transcript_9483:46-645(+)
MLRLHKQLLKSLPKPTLSYYQSTQNTSLNINFNNSQLRWYALKTKGGKTSGDSSEGDEVSGGRHSFDNPVFLEFMVRDYLTNFSEHDKMVVRDLNVVQREINLRKSAEKLNQQHIQKLKEKKQLQSSYAKAALEAIDCQNLKVEAERHDYTKVPRSIAGIPAELPIHPTWTSMRIQEAQKEKLRQIQLKKEREEANAMF